MKGEFYEKWQRGDVYSWFSIHSLVSLRLGIPNEWAETSEKASNVK